MATLNAEQIAEFEKIQDKNIIKYAENTAYVLGKNPGILKDKSKKSPDNRIAIPLAKSAVEDMTGFAASPGNTTLSYEEEVGATEAEKAELEEYRLINKKIYTHNEAKLETTELYNQGCTQGESYELFWHSDIEEGDTMVMPEFALVDNSEILPVWNRDIKPKLIAAIRFYTDGDLKYADVYYPFKMESWKRKYKKADHELYITGTRYSQWERNIDGDKTYLYKEVPLSIYPINRYSQPLFEAEKAIIDANDNITSKSTNEVDRYNAAILMMSEDAEDIMSGLDRGDRVIDRLPVDGNGWPEYLKKDMQGVTAFYKLMMDKYEQDFHKTIKVPDFSDERFAGNSSGVAIEYKLMGIEFKATQIDAYFNKGLLTRQRLIDDVIFAKEGDEPIEYTPVIENKRNLPVDQKIMIDIAEKMWKTGMVSRETLLKYLPNNIVDNIELEMERLEGEKPPVVTPVIEEEVPEEE